jgi:peptidoglycan/xylan/chitin deacetylase (PgdA/CDA1 family)
MKQIIPYILSFVILLFVGIKTEEKPASRKPASIEIAADIEDYKNKLEEVFLLDAMSAQTLIDFDEEKKTNLLKSNNYKKLLVLRTLIEEKVETLESQLDLLKQNKEVYRLQELTDSRNWSERYPEFFTEQSLNHHFDIKEKNSKYDNKNNVLIKVKSFRSFLNKISSTKDYLLLKENLNYLTKRFDLTHKQTQKTIFPSNLKNGNITGDEFPKKVWSLTFDDGPGTASSIKILEELQKRKMKATFFQLMSKIKTNSNTAKKIDDAGMEIASHSYNHLNLPKMSLSTQEYEISESTKEISKFYNKKIEFFRLPYGAGVNTKSIRDIITKNELVHVFWNVDTLDWVAHQEPSDIVKRTKEQMKATKNDAGIILFHDIHNRTAIASPQIMDELQKEGRKVCVLAEILKHINVGSELQCD